LTLIDIANLVKISEGCINIDDAENLDIFEFKFYSFYFDTVFSAKQEAKEIQQNKMSELFVEGITSLHTALR
jgi:hypothetical protein